MSEARYTLDEFIGAIICAADDYDETDYTKGFLARITAEAIHEILGCFRCFSCDRDCLQIDERYHGPQRTVEGLRRRRHALRRLLRDEARTSFNTSRFHRLPRKHRPRRMAQIRAAA